MLLVVQCYRFCWCSFFFLSSSGYGHSASRWLALVVFYNGHGPLQFPAEVWRASRAFYTQAHNWLHIQTVTQMCTPWWTHTHTRAYIYMHTNMYTLTYANIKLNTYIIIALSFSLSCTTMILECTLALFSFTFCLHWTEYTCKLEGKKRRCKTEAYHQKLKRTLPHFLLDWAYYKLILVSSLFYPLHFVCMFSLSPYYFFLQLLCTNMKKVAVQPSLQYKQLETEDSIKKQFLV